jgi:hypothetical protein
MDGVRSLSRAIGATRLRLPTVGTARLPHNSENTGNEKMKRITTLLAAGLVLIAVTTVPALLAGAQPQVVTDQNLKQMITNAKTPADHEAIAAYYDKEAQVNEAKAALHRGMANIYAKPGMTAHCNNLAKDFRRAANEDKALAAEQRAMAEKAGGQTGQ